MRVYELKQCNRIRKATSVDLVSVLTNLFQFDCDFFCLCKSRSNRLLEPTCTDQ